MRRLHPLPLLALACTQAHAGRPMTTDDASILDPNSCQLETWTLRSRASNEFWAMPACRVGEFELAAGAGRAGTSDARKTYGVLQAKTVFKPLDVNDWGIGLAFGTQFDTRKGLSGDRYAYVPISWSLNDDRLQLHTNLGWLREKATQRDFATWALGAEAQVAENGWLSLESFGRNDGRPSYQVGARMWLVQDRIQLDGSLSDRVHHSHPERALTLGLKFVTP
ncbi:hypothetical protein ACHMW6_19150 [Pseudoduganella sp. UC29_106]|uniref:hypothetical protein n=1 Tax=Pseudoduganella sp. UC29_106 TaxID=3374553 RepID=UPI0037566E2D